MILCTRWFVLAYSDGDPYARLLEVHDEKEQSDQFDILNHEGVQTIAPLSYGCSPDLGLPDDNACLEHARQCCEAPLKITPPEIVLYSWRAVRG